MLCLFRYLKIKLTNNERLSPIIYLFFAIFFTSFINLLSKDLQIDLSLNNTISISIQSSDLKESIKNHPARTVLVMGESIISNSDNLFFIHHPRDILKRIFSFSVLHKKSEVPRSNCGPAENRPLPLPPTEGQKLRSAPQGPGRWTSARVGR